MSLKYILLLLSLISIQIVGTYLFASGFLLSRLELPKFNTCENQTSRFSLDNLLKKKSLHQPKSQTCSHETPRFKRAVLILIDALRYDFAKWDYKYTNSTDTPNYINKLPILHEKLINSPGNALLFRARVDPPTTTLQRLKAITTGTLPTFVDAGSNFGGAVITEDNLLYQLSYLNRRIVFMGDDTWDAVFPNALNESYPFPSLDVFDLHTVDNGVLEYLLPSIRDPDVKRWDLLIAHFLGVDHCGHRWNPDNPAMAEKLLQMNGVLSDVFDAVDDDTLVIVLGDHGMDIHGNHGGESEPEINAAMYFYSKKQLWNHLAADEMHEIMEKMQLRNDAFEKLNGRDPNSYPYLFMNGDRTIAQIDLVPTLSFLLDIPLPFGNLGSIIPEFFFASNSPESRIVDLASVSRHNAHQILRYLNEYTMARPSSDFSLPALTAIIKNADSLFNSVTSNVNNRKRIDDDQIQILQTSIIEYHHFLRTALVSARRIWARFDVFLIASGVLVFLLCLFVSLIFITHGYLYLESISFLTILEVGAAGAIIGLMNPLRKIINVLKVNGIDSEFTVFHEALLLGSLGMIASFTMFMMKNPISNLRLPTAAKNDFFIGTLLFLLYAVAPFSDSFTIWEERTTAFLIATFCVSNFIRCLYSSATNSRKSVAINTVMLLVSSRLTLLSTVCRMEMNEHCVISDSSSMVSLTLLLCLIPITYRFISRRMGLGVLVSFIYWAIDTMEQNSMVSEEVVAFKLHFAQVIFPIVVFYNLDGVEQSEDVVAVLALIVGMTQKPLNAVMVFVGYLQIRALQRISVGLQAMEHDKKSDDGGVEGDHAATMKTPHMFLMAVLCSILSHRLYFATGHQFTLSSVQWDSGFIGVPTMNWVISPILVALNTLGAQLITSIGFLVLFCGRRDRQRHGVDLVKGAAMYCGVVGGFCTLCSAIAAGILRRHLMAPKVLLHKGVSQMNPTTFVDLSSDVLERIFELVGDHHLLGSICRYFRDYYISNLQRFSENSGLATRLSKYYDISLPKNFVAYFSCQNYLCVEKVSYVGNFVDLHRIDNFPVARFYIEVISHAVRDDVTLHAKYMDGLRNFANRKGDMKTEFSVIPIALKLKWLRLAEDKSTTTPITLHNQLIFLFSLNRELQSIPIDISTDDVKYVIQNNLFLPERFAGRQFGNQYTMFADDLTWSGHRIFGDYGYWKGFNALVETCCRRNLADDLNVLLGSTDFYFPCEPLRCMGAAIVSGSYQALDILTAHLFNRRLPPGVWAWPYPTSPDYAATLVIELIKKDRFNELELLYIRRFVLPREILSPTMKYARSVESATRILNIIPGGHELVNNVEYCVKGRPELVEHFYRHLTFREKKLLTAARKLLAEEQETDEPWLRYDGQVLFNTTDIHFSKTGLYSKVDGVLLGVWLDDSNFQPIEFLDRKALRSVHRWAFLRRIIIFISKKYRS
ncbi:mannose-ethanolamine phosphotransferase gpi13 [Nowakowskiella sp. JEL0407]|nr:mannose-ethanolamine phosphotransferase gpi13 [Nowakowskiella sp. JEL0407]